MGEVNEHIDECLAKKAIQQQDSIDGCLAKKGFQQQDSIGESKAKKSALKKQISLKPYFSP